MKEHKTMASTPLVMSTFMHNYSAGEIPALKYRLASGITLPPQGISVFASQCISALNIRVKRVNIPYVAMSAHAEVIFVLGDRVSEVLCDVIICLLYTSDAADES